jgi:hypothetical protein
VLVSLCAVVVLCLASVSLRYLSPSLFSPSSGAAPSRQSAETSRDLFLAAQQAALHSLEDRKVYPYSVVPGGVRDARELKWAAEHDPVVAEHYAGFDYDHARVVRLVLARTAYVSYRIGKKIYWTRRRITLKKGETVITDGKMTARTRCANRVEELPQQATSMSEPPALKFEEPMLPLPGTAMSTPPVPFESALLNPPGTPGVGPAPPLGLYNPLGGGGYPWVPLSPPPLPSVCGIGPKKPGHGSAGGAIVVATAKGKKKKIDPCGNAGGVGEVPEPGTWLLVGSGIAFLFWKNRHRLVPAPPLA